MADLVAIVDGRGATHEAVAATMGSLAAEGLTGPAAISIGSETVEIPLGDGTHCLWIEAGTVLLPGALERFIDAAARFPSGDVLYSDDWAVRRPDHSPIRMRSQDYLGAVRVFRSSALAAIRGFSDRVDDAEAYDASLRLVAAGSTFVHIPEVLYRVEAGGRGPSASGRIAAIEGHLRDIGVAGSVHLDDQGVVSIDYELVGEPLVSVIIPTRGGSAVIAGRGRVLVTEAIRGILATSTYTKLEFVVVADDPTPQSVVDELMLIAPDSLRLVRWSEAFSFSGKMNRGAVHASGEYLLLLNDDIEVATPGWIEGMLGLAQQDDVGLVGALLYFEDGSVQHGGHLYRDGAAGHIAFNWPAEWQDPLQSLSVEREVAGATAACAMISADDYWRVGGFSSLFPSNYNDVDLCLKLRSTGLSVVWTPKARLYHFESKTRVATVAPSETEAVGRRWGSVMQRDPYWPDYSA